MEYEFGFTLVNSALRTIPATSAFQDWTIDLFGSSGSIPVVGANPILFTNAGELEVTGLSVSAEQVSSLTSAAAVQLFNTYGVGEVFRLRFRVNNIGGTDVRYFVFAVLTT
jgi:hypothetical protein